MYSNIYMTNILSNYKKVNLIPFSHSISIDANNKKKLSNIPLFLTINEYNKKFINPNFNGLSIRTGTMINENSYLIVLDIDNKDDEENIKNGLPKWLEILKQKNCNDLETPTQKTGNNGLHLLFKVSEEQFQYIKPIISLKIDGKSYSIDVKAANGFIIVEPSTYNGKSYKWIKKPYETDILDMPLWLFELIKQKPNMKPLLKEKKIEVEPKPIVNDVVTQSSISITLSSSDNQTLQLLNILSIDRVNNYQLWLALGFLIFGLDLPNGLEVFLMLSRRSSKYENDEYVIAKYQSIIKGKRQLNFKTLISWAKHDNPEEFNKLEIVVKPEESIVQKVEISRRYLLDKNMNWGQSDILINGIVDFFKNEEVKSFNLKSPYDTGKTQMLKRIIEKFLPKRILWVSYRKSLTNDIKGNFEELGFESYMDGKYHADRLIVQVESLMKLNKAQEYLDQDTVTVPSYDLVIIDEVESILCQFNSNSTFKGLTSEIFEYLEEIIHNSKKLITLDGDMTNRTYHYINSFGKSLNIVNTIKFNPKDFNLLDDNEAFHSEIFKALDNEKKIVIVSMSKKEAESLTIKLTSNYPKLKILLYTSITGDKEKNELVNVNDIWVQADILIYSPTIEAGVNFDLEHFDQVFGILSNKSTSQRAFMQMLNRVRKLTENKVFLLNDKNFSMRNVTNYITFEDEVEALKYLPNEFKMSTIYKTVNGQRVKTINYDNYTINYLYNRVEEENKKPFYFLSKLKEIMLQKGHCFTYEDKKEKKQRGISEKDKNNFLLELVQTKVINDSKYTLLNEKKNRNMATREEKILLAKKYYCIQLGLDNFNEELIKSFYHRIGMISKFMSLIDEENFHETNDAKNKIDMTKLLLVRDLLNVLGFINIFDTKKVVTSDELMKQFKVIFSKNKIYTCQKTAKMHFEVPFFKLTDSTTTKQILGHLNKILNEYGLKITAKQIRTKEGKEYVYFVEILYHLDEIVKYKMLKGFKLIDNNNIFCCDKRNLIEFFDETKICRLISQPILLDDDDNEEEILSSLDQL